MKKKKASRKITASELDRKFDEGNEDILEYFETKEPLKRILVDFPQWMIDEFDKEAKHLGLSRQAIIKTWLNEHINAKYKRAG